MIENPIKKPDLIVIFEGFNKKWAKPHACFDSDYRMLSPEIYLNSDKLIFINGRFFIEVFRTNQTVNIRACFYERLDQRVRKIIGFKTQFINQNYQYLMRMIFYFPLFFLLQKKHRIIPIHAATVNRGNEALAFLGLNSAGKSTLAYYLTINHGFKLCADNFTLIDDSLKVYPFYELPRFDKKSLRLLNISSEEKKKAYGKYYLNNPDFVSLKNNIFLTKLFILRRIMRGNKVSLHPLKDKNLILHQINAIHNYIKEFHNYTFYNFFDFGEMPSYESIMKTVVNSIKKIYYLDIPQEKGFDLSMKEVENAL